MAIGSAHINAVTFLAALLYLASSEPSLTTL